MSLRRILIVGGSTRAAADSVRRAGWQPVCADMFADLDLRATAEIIRVEKYPDSLPDDVATVRADAWFYCGALENHPEIIERILVTNSSIGPLLGSSPQGVKIVRNPFWLSNTLRWEGVTTLDVANQSTPPVPNGSWLQKPLASAGGRLIRVWDESAASVSFPEPHYFQARARGVGLSAIFRFENGKSEWLGASQELGAPPASHPPTLFSYCGSCGPLGEIRQSAIGGSPMERISDSVKSKLTKIAAILARQVKGLRGLVGLDFRLDGDDFWLTEVNPRYTASVEILEFATGRSLMNPSKNQHDTGGFDSSSSTQTMPKVVGLEDATRPMSEKANALNSRPSVVIKQVLYAWSPMTAPDLSRFIVARDPWQTPLLADIPVLGIPIRRGCPICTVMACGENLAAAEVMLQHRLSLIHDVLSS